LHKVNSYTIDPIRLGYQRSSGRLNVRTIELSTWGTAPQKLQSLKRSLEIIYGVTLDTYSIDVPLENLYPTEDFLENDKLALVFMKTIEENYDVPIVVVEHGNDYFILDGHHRAYISSKIQRKTMKSNALRFPKKTSYRHISKSSLENMPIKEVEVLNDPILLGWSRILKILKQYEALYHMNFHMKREKILLTQLSPTEPELLQTQIDGIAKLRVPITCIRQEDRYYVLDGHARCLRAKQLRLKSIEAIVFLPQIPIHFGIVKTAKEMRLSSLEDIRVIRQE
jgi:hypothetical protein